jgi:hypothetical protein
VKKKSAKKIKRGVRGEEGRSVGVMKDKELKLVEVEASLTRGGAGEVHVQGIYRYIYGCVCVCVCV